MQIPDQNVRTVFKPGIGSIVVKARGRLIQIPFGLQFIRHIEGYASHEAVQLSELAEAGKTWQEECPILRVVGLIRVANSELGRYASPAGFQKAALQSSANPLKAPPMLRALEPTPGRAKPPPAKQVPVHNKTKAIIPREINRLFISHLSLLGFT
jgi:hypothetical protein